MCDTETDSSARIDARQIDNQPSNDTDGPAYGDGTANDTSQISQNGKQVRRRSLAAGPADECGTGAARIVTTSLTPQTWSPQFSALLQGGPPDVGRQFLGVAAALSGLPASADAGGDTESADGTTVVTTSGGLEVPRNGNTETSVRVAAHPEGIGLVLSNDVTSSPS